MNGTNVRGQRSIPILRLVRDLDEFDLVTISLSIGARLMSGEGSQDEGLRGLDVSGRRSSPNLKGAIKRNEEDRQLECPSRREKDELTLYEFLGFFPSPFFLSFLFFFFLRSESDGWLLGKRLSYCFRTVLPYCCRNQERKKRVSFLKICLSGRGRRKRRTRASERKKTNLRVPLPSSR